MKKIPMTLLGAEKLREELEYRKKVQRKKIISDISEARKHGDLKENSEYHAAREQQFFCEVRIKDIEEKLANAQIIDIKKIKKKGIVIFGATVSVLNLEKEDKYTYRIVGEEESDLKKNLLSVNSPMARGLIGKKKEDMVVIKTPCGDVKYEIINVEYL